MDSGRDSPDSSAHHQSNKDKATLGAQTPVSGGAHNLPEEIIVEILARLPVKSLLRFRCVSKSWLTLISSQQFIKTHLNISRLDRNLSNYRIMLTFPNPTYDLKHCSLNSLMYEPCTDLCSMDHPEKHLQTFVHVVGSCNGLICFASYEIDLFLWNPSTRQSRKLPPVNFNIKGDLPHIFCFGFLESHDDYKVVGIFWVSGNDGAYKSLAKIYSLKTNSWKKAEDFKGVPLRGSGMFASGKLHWFTGGLVTSSKMDIVSLDIESEVYGIVEQPNYGEGNFDLFLWVLGECLCVLCNYDEISADLWVLKEYGVRESWTKMATIPYVDTPWRYLYTKPLFMLRNGKILFIFGVCFLVYDPEDNSLRIPETSNLKAFLETYMEADIYVESLVSPFANEKG